MQGILDQVDPNQPYAVNTLFDEQIEWFAGDPKYKVIRQKSAAHWFKGPKCRVPCTHYSNWYGYAIFSYGAMLKMADYVQKNELINVCRIWDTTHDVGLGIFVWEMAIPFLPGIVTEHIVQLLITGYQ